MRVNMVNTAISNVFRELARVYENTGLNGKSESFAM